MQTYRLTPIALALLYIFPTNTQAATNMPLFKVDPGLLQSAPATSTSAPAEISDKTQNSTPANQGTASTKTAGTPKTDRNTAALPAREEKSGQRENDDWYEKLETTNPNANPETAPIIVHADRIQGHQDQEVEAFGNVELHKPGQALFAEHLVYKRQEDEVFAEKNVRLEQKGSVVTGPELRLQMTTNQGYMNQPAYELAATHARGVGDKLVFQGEDKYRAENASYTTCPVGQDDWFLRAGDINIDRTTQVGTAHSAYIEFKGVPLLYSPWIQFPLNNQRKSGLLIPSFGSTGNSGAEFKLPFYWNIAPEYDATITPRVMAKRGTQVATEFRYLQPTYTGNTQIEFLPNDAITDSNRVALNIQHNHNLGSGWTGLLNIQKVSDDNYFRDLSTQLTSTSTVNLPREGVLNYNSGSWWNFAARVQRFQTLQDPLATVATPYHRTPQLTLNGLKQNVLGTDMGFTSEFVDFNNPTPTWDHPDGQRLTFYPSVSMPLSNSYAYITPKIGVHATRYTLDNNQTTLPNSTRTLPIFSLDSGMVFERDADLMGQAYVQTLEPRLYYLNVPYTDQNLIPNFDTAEADFNFAQIFSENHFTGGDRINDANQLTAALTTRILQPDSGLERIRAAIGQRYYFTDQQVTLTPSTAPRTTKTSDFLAALSAQITPAWFMDTGWQYNPDSQQTQKASLGARYRPEPGKVVNMAYRFTRSDLSRGIQGVEQVDLSTQWPISGKISGLARWNQSILDSTLVEGLAGIEYNGGCWALRTVIHRFATATTQSTDSIFIQLELNGVSSLGFNPLDVLRRNISGYTKTNEPTQ